MCINPRFTNYDIFETSLLQVVSRVEENKYVDKRIVGQNKR